jgi:hypothetical protein
MNNEEAKFILNACRPNGSDAGDAVFEPALAQARNQPDLAAWFAKQQALDAVVAAKFATVEPPVGLRDAILAGVKVTVPAVRPWWVRPAWMGAAAGVAMLLAVGAALWPNRAESLERFVLDDAQLSALHGGHGQENNGLQNVLNDPGTRLGQKLPVEFANLVETGCRTIQCRGHEVLELCFKRNGVWFHAYFVRRRDFPAIKGSGAPVITDHGSTSMATWVDDEHVVMVVSKTGRRNLEALL